MCLFFLLNSGSWVFWVFFYFYTTGYISYYDFWCIQFHYFLLLCWSNGGRCLRRTKLERENEKAFLLTFCQMAFWIVLILISPLLWCQSKLHGHACWTWHEHVCWTWHGHADALFFEKIVHRHVRNTSF